MPRSLINPAPIPRLNPQTIEVEYNDYSEGVNRFNGNDVLDPKFWRHAQNARMPKLGEYETRRGFDSHSAPVGEAEYDSITSNTGGVSLTTTSWVAHDIVNTSGGRLTKLELYMRKVAGAIGDVVVDIYSDSSGEPGSLITSTTIDAADFTTSYEYVTAYFVDAPLFTAGTSYWAVLRIQTGGSGTYQAAINGTSTSGATTSDSGGSWTTGQSGLQHKAYAAPSAKTKGVKRLYKSDGTAVTVLYVDDTLYKVNDGDGSLTVIKSGLSTDATYLRGVVINDIFYYINGKDGLRKWDFTTESQVRSQNYSHIVAHQGLLFLVDAVDTNKIIFSEFADYETFKSTSFIYVPAPKTGDPITAVVTVNGVLAIWTRYNKHILYGTDTATFQLEPAPARKGTFSQETVAFDTNFAYFISDDGVYRFNGTSDKLLSVSNYDSIRDIKNKDRAVIQINRSRLYVWYNIPSKDHNSYCWVYNLNFDMLESLDTSAYVARADTAFREDYRLLVASPFTGQVFWQELDTNDYSNMGQGYEFMLQTHDMHFGTPSRDKEIRFWKPRFSAQAGDYTIDCKYSTDFGSSQTTALELETQGTGSVWGGSGVNWGSFTWGTSKELQADLYVPGGHRRISIAYSNDKPRQPHRFLGHTFVVEIRDIR